MADVQPDRAMPVHRDILTALCLADLTPSERKVALAVIRASWGWSSTTTDERLSQAWVSRLTGIRGRVEVRRAFAGLLSKRVVELVRPYTRAGCRPAEWRFVKDYDAWTCLDAEIPWRQAPSGSRTTGGEYPRGGQTTGGEYPRGSNTTGGECPRGQNTPEGRMPPSPRGQNTPVPTGVEHPREEAQGEPQGEAQDHPLTPAGGSGSFLSNPGNPDPKPRDDPAKEVWLVFAPLAGIEDEGPDTDFRTYVEARVSGQGKRGAKAEKYTVEDLCNVARWVFQSDAWWCQSQRESGNTNAKTIFKPTGMMDRKRDAAKWIEAGAQGPPPKPGTRESYPKAEELDGYGALVRLEGEYDDEPRPTACACGQQIPQEFAPVLGWYRFERCCAPKGAAG